MAIDHIGIVSRDPARLRAFYEKYFEGSTWVWKEEGTDMVLFFLSFPGSSARLEIQSCQNDLPDRLNPDGAVGLGHLSFTVQSSEALRQLTERMIADGVPLRTPPTAYGRDFYESSFWDPDGNIVEIAVGQETLWAEYAAAESEAQQ